MSKPKDAKHITIDEARWAAYQDAADRAGLSRPAWILQQCDAALPAKVRAKLSEPRTVGRPKKVDDE